MSYLDVKNSKEEEDHWFVPSDFERERFERHADFLIDQGYMAVDPYTLAVKVAWKLRNSPRPRDSCTPTVAARSAQEDALIADSMRVKQILFNLLGNPASSRKGARLRCGCARWPTDATGSSLLSPIPASDRENRNACIRLPST
jgi:hypothetical protein